MSISEEVREFILQHEDTDTYQLALEAHRYKDLPMGFIIQQIRCRQKAKNKLPTWYNHSAVVYPDETAVEQASSELTGRLKSELTEGKRGVDLTGGLGVDAFFLSDSFDSFDYVETDPQRVNCARHNYEVFEKKNIKVVNESATAYLNKNGSMDAIYLDPSRRNSSGEKTFLWKDCEPDVPGLMPELLSKAKTVLVKASPLLDITKGVADLGGVQRVIVVSVKNECKEVLFEKCSGIAGYEEVPVHVFHFPGNQYHYYHYSSSLLEESRSEVSVSAPLDYIYLPYPAMMKAGLFNWMGEAWGVSKINKNTHVYTSSMSTDNFPGELLKVQKVLPYSGKVLQKESSLNSGKYRIISRNFKDDKEVLKKKLGIKEGGETCLIALRNQNGKPILIIADPARHYEN